MLLVEHSTTASNSLQEENLYQIKEARYHLQKMHQALNEAMWHLKLSARHYKSIDRETMDDYKPNQESYLEEEYEDYMAKNCTCDREESDCQCMNFEQFCEHFIAEVQRDWEEFYASTKYDEQLENF